MFYLKPHVRKIEEEEIANVNKQIFFRNFPNQLSFDIKIKVTKGLKLKKYQKCRCLL